MNMTTQKPVPDYGEPWGFDGENWITDARNKKILNLDSIHSRNARRLIDCVNACQKMAEPADEIQAMREAIKEAHKFAMDILWNYECGIEIDLKCEAALAKLQPFLA